MTLDEVTDLLLAAANARPAVREVIAMALAEPQRIHEAASYLAIMVTVDTRDIGELSEAIEGALVSALAHGRPGAMN